MDELDVVDDAYSDAPAAVGCEEGFLLLGDKPLTRGRSSDVWLAAAPDGAGGMQLAIARRATALALEMGEPYADFVRGIQVRATFAPPAPRLLGSLGKDGRIKMVVEEHAGDVSFEDVVAATSSDGASMSIGLALHIGARVASLFAAAERHGNAQMQLGPRDVRVAWDGVVRALPKAFPRWDERDGGAMVGTVEPNIVWAPPERVLGYRSTRRSEQYMLGVMMFEALTGKHPLHGEGMLLTQRLMRTVRDECPLVQSVRADVPADVAAIVDRCTRRNADVRFPSWSELTAALAEAHDRVEPVDEVAFAGLLAQ
jgi:serine/threonine protein kinase